MTSTWYYQKVKDMNNCIHLVDEEGDKEAKSPEWMCKRARERERKWLPFINNIMAFFFSWFGFVVVSDGKKTDEELKITRGMVLFFSGGKNVLNQEFHFFFWLSLAFFVSYVFTHAHFGYLLYIYIQFNKFPRNCCNLQLILHHGCAYMQLSLLQLLNVKVSSDAVLNFL